MVVQDHIRGLHALDTSVSKSYVTNICNCMPCVCIFNNSKIKSFENLSVYVEILKLLILYLCKNCNQIHMLNTMILQFIFYASLIIHLTYQHVKTPIIHQNILVSLKKISVTLFVTDYNFVTAKVRNTLFDHPVTARADGLSFKGTFNGFKSLNIVSKLFLPVLLKTNRFS